MTKKIYALLLALLCVGFYSCKEDKEDIDPSSATPVITFAYDGDLEGDLNKADNLPVVAVIRSAAGLESVKMQIKLSDNSLRDYKTVNQFFNKNSYSLSEKLIFSEDYAAFVVTATDRLGRSESSTLNFKIIELKEPPTVVFTPDKIVYNEITNVPEDMPNTMFVAASGVGIKNLEMWLVTKDGQTDYPFPGEAPEFGENCKGYVFDQLIMYKEGSRGFKVKVTDIYDQVKIVTLPVTYVSVPAPVVTFSDAAPLMADKNQKKNVGVTIEAKGNIKSIRLYRMEGTVEVEAYKEDIAERGTTSKTISPEVTFTTATTGLKAVVTDFAGKSSTATLKAIVGIQFVESVKLGTQSYANGLVEDGMTINAVLSLKDMTTYSVDAALTDASNMDLKFYAYGGSAVPRLYSLSNTPDSKNGEFKGTSKSLSDLGVKNMTKFKVLTGFDFDNATADQINALTGITADAVNPFAAGDIIAFKTAATSAAGGERIGVLKIVSITTGPSSSVIKRVATLSIKFPKQ